ncbi:GDP-L-fucose synthase [Kaistia geumhonensis]|uniref:GDP-L-fucose synthase n=1 Tax=Kaistia geumhonensis TaxID=410839 RepID=A0ABU0M154_9HYPH|nr:GDP-L-fucose synthase [Kaistia geumhonensis]MCX5480100.1 GDP-L-fucose synthase [Kaistia geumhonensis]MDQ0514671.1 GDP-L-fucose synthase [Kaistia geumhonensis]
MTEFSLADRRVYVAGHRGMVGSAIVRRLENDGVEVVTATREQADLRDPAAVKAFLADTKPDVVVVAAAKVGGILANDTYPADFLYENLMIEANLVDGSFKSGVEKLLFLGSSCIYPKVSPQPIPEDALLTGPLESTNEWYAIAKIAGIKLCQAYRKQHGVDYISAMPSNLFGPNDYFDPQKSHVIPALLRRFHEAEGRGDASVTCWGTGTPRREFLYVDDLADACVFLLKSYSGYEHVNVGTGDDITIRELAESVKKVTGFKGEILWDTSKPDGTMLKRMDVSRINALGWKATTPFETGLEKAYRWFLENPIRT